MRPPVLAPCFVAALAVLGPSRAGQAEASRESLRIEAGADVDTNPGRVERVQGQPPEPVETSPLGRLVVAAEGATPWRHRQSLALSAGVAGKLFTARSATLNDILVLQATGSWFWAVADGTVLSLSGLYFDAYQHRTPRPEEARDFRSGTPQLGVEATRGSARFSLATGYRWFAYKPDPNLSFAGPMGQIAYRQSHLAPLGSDGGDWDWTVMLMGEARRFPGALCAAGTLCQGIRHDLYGSASAEVTRTGACLLGLGGIVSGNRSTSYGESLFRLIGSLRVGLALPADITLAARADLVYTRYGDELALARDPISGRPLVSIEDENRSTGRIELVRPLGAHAEVGLRYALYTNALSVGSVRYERHTASLFVASSWTGP